MRWDRETIRAKIEWEGSDGIEWFKPSEVPEELEHLWKLALNAKMLYEHYLDKVYEELEVE